MANVIIVDTNVLIGALIGKQYSANRKLIELCLLRKFQPLINDTLFLEYEAVFNRQEIIDKSPYSIQESKELFSAFLVVCQWTKIYYSWRPNLVDENDNYLIELAVAGNAGIIVTNNTKDFRQSELKFPQIQIKQPKEVIWLP
ncbi:MAG: putative toxin-antitoxin system toxin component, PIN family [Xenococcaceae cyanobacterium]